MAKVLFLVRSLFCGGAERQLALLAKGLKSHGWDIVVVAFYSGGPMESDLQKAGIQVHSLDKKGRWDMSSVIRRLPRLLRRERPQILHSFLVEPNIIASLLKPFFRNMRVVWGVRASHMDLLSYDWFPRMTFRVSGPLSHIADSIIVNSAAGREYHISCGYPREKMKVIPNGIETTMFRPDPLLRNAIRKEWKIRDDEILIGHAARFDPMKDHATFLKAAALLARQRKGVHFACVGGGPEAYGNNLREYSKALGLNSELIWGGHRNDMCAVYNAFDIMTSTSCGEGFPNVIGEAMSCGVPCVVTDVGDSALIVGEHGMLTAPRSPADLADACISMMEQAGDAVLKEKVRQRIVTNFNADSMILRTSETFTSLLT